jgi:hypothetical protein
MVARGETSYLIASLAEIDGIFWSGEEQSSGSSELYLMVIWAITCALLSGRFALVPWSEELRSYRLNE